MDKGKYEPKAPALETFIPTVDFTGWPDGYSTETRKGVQFTAGVESIPVSPEYAALIREKGLAPVK